MKINGHDQNPDRNDEREKRLTLLKMILHHDHFMTEAAFGQACALPSPGWLRVMLTLGQRQKQ